MKHPQNQRNTNGETCVMIAEAAGDLHLTGAHFWLCHAGKTKRVLKLTASLGAANKSVAAEQWFLLRVGGPHIQTAVLRQTRASHQVEWQGSFAACQPGNYSLHVRSVFANDVRDDASWNASCSKLHDPMNSTLLDLYVWEDGQTNHSAQGCANLWRWRTPPTDDARRQLQRLRACGIPSSSNMTATCPHPHADPHNSRHAINLLTYVGKDRRPNERTMPGLCFVGDSQTRNVFNSVMCAFQGRLMEDRQSSHQICSDTRHSNTKYFGANYPSDWIARPLRASLDLAQCGSVVMNFGQWPCSNRQPTPWPRARFERELQQSLSVASHWAAQRSRRLFFWATNPSPFRRDMAICPPSDWRFPHIIEAYNAIAKRVAARHNITFIDTYSIVFQLLDLSFDGAHYGGSIGHALAVTILDEVAEHT